MKTIFITGCTSGFGKAIAEKFAGTGNRLIITGRRQERLAEVKVQLETDYKVEVTALCFDVRDRQACLEAIDNLPSGWKNIDVLVNNAGLAVGRDTYDTASLDDWDLMLDTNVKGLNYISKAIIPFMIERHSGHIINIGSIAGKEVYQYGNGYCASKFAVEAITQAMRIDLLPHNIKVTGIHPGAAETEFSLVRFKGDEEKAAAMYKGFTPLQANDIAEVVYYVTTQPAHVCINDLVIMPTAQASGIYFHKKVQ
ncbi:MAG: SDR family NAD(P)-dependent oxidoreductase [Bacteroidota bacterium]